MNRKQLGYIPLATAVAAFLMSPDFYNVLPDKYAHMIAGLALVAATAMPSIFGKVKKDETDAPKEGDK